MYLFQHGFCLSAVYNANEEPWDSRTAHNEVTQAHPGGGSETPPRTPQVPQSLPFPLVPTRHTHAISWDSSHSPRIFEVLFFILSQ